MADQQNKERANAENKYDITAADLPLTCPTDKMTSWDSHPRVFLTLEDGQAKCPYCGAEYTLTGDAAAAHH